MPLPWENILLSSLYSCTAMSRLLVAVPSIAVYYFMGFFRAGLVLVPSVCDFLPRTWHHSTMNNCREE